MTNILCIIFFIFFPIVINAQYGFWHTLLIPNSCKSPWGTVVKNGNYIQAYPQSSGSSCIPETRYCYGGKLTGTATFQSCQENYWVVGGFGCCTAPINSYSGTKSRQVTCQNSSGSLPDFLCNSATRPTSLATCNSLFCAGWYTWSNYGGNWCGQPFDPVVYPIVSCYSGSYTKGTMYMNYPYGCKFKSTCN